MCLSLPLFLCAQGSVCVTASVRVWYIAHPQMRQAGGPIALLWARQQAGEAAHNSSHTNSHVSPFTWRQKVSRIKKQPPCIWSSMCTYVCEFSCVCVIEHMCVYHDASPQLSHSFPAASRGWKRVKPQTSGAPQPIRIVYLASHGRLAEQEHTASHTALHWKPLPSLSLSLTLFLFFHSLKLLWLHLLSCFPPPFALFLQLVLPSSQMQAVQDVPDVLSW